MSEFNPYTPPEALRKNAEKNDALPEEPPALDEAKRETGKPFLQTTPGSVSRKRVVSSRQWTAVSAI